MLRKNPFGSQLAVPFLLLVISISVPTGAQTVFRHPTYDYTVDIPVGWEVIDGEDTRMISFSDPSRRAVMQVITFGPANFATVEEIDRELRLRLGAEGDTAPFRYRGWPAIFADYTFAVGDFAVRGYAVLLNTDAWDYAVLSYVPTEFYDQYHDLSLSAIDSFSAATTRRTVEGPVRAFFTAGIPSPNALTDTVLSMPDGLPFVLPRVLAADDFLDGYQMVIEREARILRNYTPTTLTPAPYGRRPPPWVVAWRRFFRMAYRDSYEALRPVASALHAYFVRSGVERTQMPGHLLQWLQTARYLRSGTLSDLVSPPASLASFAGDCDTLSLAYAILLHHLQFDAILMVSDHYDHAMVGVDIAGEGARFPFEGKEWLVAEVTDRVAIGLIDRERSDPTHWIGVKLDPTVVW